MSTISNMPENAPGAIWWPPAMHRWKSRMLTVMGHRMQRPSGSVPPIKTSRPPMICRALTVGIHPLLTMSAIQSPTGVPTGGGGMCMKLWKPLTPKTTNMRPNRMRQMRARIFMGGILRFLRWLKDKPSNCEPAYQREGICAVQLWGEPSSLPCAWAAGRAPRTTSALQKLWRDAPRRGVRPAAQFLERPLVGLVRVARRAGVGNAELLRERGRDEAEGVAADEVVLDGLLDARHVAGGALAPGAVGGVVRVFGNSPLQPGGIHGVVARQAERVASGDDAGGVVVAVDVVAVEAAQLAVVHGALHEVVALHAVFVGGHVGELEEVGHAGAKLFELPEVRELFTGLVADGPVVILARDGVPERLALAMALDAGVVAADPIQCRGIDDVLLRGMGGVQASRAVTFFAAHIPLGGLLGFDVVVHRVAAVAQRAGGAVEVALAVEGHPPVRAFFNVEGKPLGLFDVPLRGKDEVVVAAFGEVALFPSAAVDEGYIAEVEAADGVGVREVAEHGFGVGFRIADDVGHARLLPPGV